MSPLLCLVLYGAAVVLVSLLGGWLPIYVRLTHARLQLMSSLVAGFMLGVALLILLPHALMAIEVGTAMGFLILGLLVMFFLERFFAYHHHDVPQGFAVEPGHDHSLHPTPGHDHPHHAHGHGHSHHGPAGEAVAHSGARKLSWGGAATGLVLHSLIDGVALAAAVYADTSIEGSFWPGFVVFLVVALHRPLDAMTLLTLTANTGWSERRRHLLNGAFALAVPLGSLLFLLGLRGDVEHSVVAGSAVAFAAGVFLCVSLSDLLPELQFHSHDRVPLSVALLLGLGLATLVYLFESRTHDHAHDHGPGATGAASPAAGPEGHDRPAGLPGHDHGHDHPH